MQLNVSVYRLFSGRFDACHHRIPNELVFSVKYISIFALFYCWLLISLIASSARDWLRAICCKNTILHMCLEFCSHFCGEFVGTQNRDYLPVTRLTRRLSRIVSTSVASRMMSIKRFHPRNSAATIKRTKSQLRATDHRTIKRTKNDHSRVRCAILASMVENPRCNFAICGSRSHRIPCNQKIYFPCWWGVRA